MLRCSHSLIRSLAARSLLLGLGLALAVGAGGCSRTKPKKHWWQFWRAPSTELTAEMQHPDSQFIPPAPDVLDPEGGPGSRSIGPDSGELPPPPVAEGTLAEPEARREQPAGAVSGLQTVYFAYDSAELSADARAILDQTAQWLKANPGYEIQIGGHTDERGTVEYNLNLGDRRAKAVKEYLVSRGIDPNRMHTISYGEEMPIAQGATEEAYSLNRRAQFLVY